MISQPKILFICGSLEPGKSGVGDYTRVIAREIRQLHGVVSVILALNDDYVDTETDTVLDSSSQIREIRLPKGSAKTWRKKLNSIIRTFNPDWISLQYVGYAYNSNGCSDSLMKLLKPYVKTIKLQIMFHELWEGFGIHDSLKARFRGVLQKRSVQGMIATLNPAVVHTQNGFYIEQLRQLGIEVKYLPIFSNIPVVPRATEPSLKLINDLTGLTITKQNRKEYLLFTFFGSIYPNWPGVNFMEHIHQVSADLERKIVFLSMGKIGSQKQLWDSLRSVYGQNYGFFELGFLEANEISILLQEVDFGIASTPFEALGKSGSFVTMQEHGLHVFASKNMLRKKRLTSELESEKHAHPIDEHLAEIITHPPDKGNIEPRMEQTLKSFVKDLELL